MSDEKRRGGYRKLATELIGSLKDLLDQSPPDIPEIKVKLDHLRDIKLKINNFDENIVIKLSDDEEALFMEIKESERRNGLIDKQIIVVESFLNKLDDTGSEHSGVSSLSHMGSNRLFNLPKLNLPIFKGDALEFGSFWDLFDSAIHSNPELKDIQKFSYLKSLLREEALQLLNGFSVTSSQYEEAVTLLKGTYGQVSYVTEGHILKLVNIREPKYNYNNLSAFRAAFECHIRGLKSLDLDMDNDTVSIIIATILINKLPKVIRDNLERARRETNWNLGTFREALNKEINLIQNKDKEVKGQSESEFKGRSKTKAFNSSSGSTVGSFNTTTPQHQEKLNSSPPQRRCGFCAGPHLSYECSQYKSIYERKMRVNELGLCRKCLRSGHVLRDCKSKFSCYTCKSPYHNSAICNSFAKCKSTPRGVDGSSHSNIPKGETVEENKQICQSESVNVAYSGGVALPTAMLCLQSKFNKCYARALVDMGSQRSFITSSLAARLGVKPYKKIMLSINGFNSKGQRSLYDLVNLKIYTDDGLIEISVIVIKKLPTSIQMPGIGRVVKDLKELKVRLADPNLKGNEVANIEILIGVDHYSKFMAKPYIINNINLIKTNVGDLILGELPARQNEITYQGYISVLEIDIREGKPMGEKRDLEILWDLDAIGIKANEASPIDKRVMREFKDSIIYRNGKYIAKLPWKSDHPSLPDNYALAKSRLYSLLNKMRKTPDLLDSYQGILKEQLELGFIEEVNPYTYIPPDAKVHYLPHHGILKNSSTTPLRIVYDCSAGKVSLNDCLWSGPSLVTDLTNILLRFRLRKYAVTSDIEKAFLQIHLMEKDKDSTRFLWAEDPFDPNSKLKTFRFRVVLFGSTCSQFLLNASIRHHLENSHSPWGPKMIKDLYIDNLSSTFEEENELIKYFYEATELMSQAGLKLREWASNSESAAIEFKKAQNYLRNKTSKILGMEWNTQDDSLSYSAMKLRAYDYTKRGILKFSASVFDPLGYILPITLRARLFLQTLWKCKYDWDAILDEYMTKEWNDIEEDIKKVLTLSLPRQAVFNKDVQLHIFSDASTRAYGTAAYVVEDNSSNLIMAKAKTAPLKELTVPKLELTAVVLSTRLMNFILEAYKDELNFNSLHIWTDSQVVIQWIQSKKLHQPYVQNRLDEIRKLNLQLIWHYVPTTDNPADMLSRGVSFKKFNLDFWLHGPEWLLSPSEWPRWPDLQSDELEERVLLTSSFEINSLINIEDYSDYKKLLKVTALVFRFIQNLKLRDGNSEALKSKKERNSLCHNLSKEEIGKAEIYLIKVTQSLEFKTELECLREGKTSQRILDLHLFLDEEDIIRCRCRLDHGYLSFNEKYPILLPKKSPLSRLIISYYHLQNHHVGCSQLIGILRQRFWMPSMRQAVKRYTKTCILCKRLQGLHYPEQPIAPLPEHRISRSRPFTVAGVDFTGHLFVKNKTKISKVYVLLFTCASTRAVHLELVDDGSISSFLMALRRFIARRGIPSIIISDNATTFIGTSKYLKEIQRLPSVREYLNEKRIDWRFIPAKAPWFGAFYERMIGLTKTSLKRTLGNTLATREELATILIEIELTLNTRPITYVSGELNEEPLTPSHLLVGYNINSLPVPEEYLEQDETFGRKPLTRRHKYLLQLIERFWRKWKSEYLLSLRKHKLKLGAPEVKKGDIVLIEDEGPRLKWRLGKIVDLHHGIDGRCRSVSLKTNYGLITRPLIKLYPLEVDGEEEESNPVLNSQELVNRNLSQRPIRQAAVEARKKFASQFA